MSIISSLKKLFGLNPLKYGFIHLTDDRVGTTQTEACGEVKASMKQEAPTSISGGSSHRDILNTPQERKSDVIFASDIFDYIKHDEVVSVIPPEKLREVVRIVPILSAIINTRIAQVTAFGKPSYLSPIGIGYSIKTRDPQYQPSEAERKEMLYIENFLFNCGDPDVKRFRVGFADLLRMVTYDCLVIDRGCIEKVRRVNGKLCEIIPVDGALVQYEFNSEGIIENYKIVINNEVKRRIALDDLVMIIRNRRTDRTHMYYGYSEVEQAIGAIAALIQAEEYNKRNFTKGALPRGFMVFRGGEISREMLTEIRRWFDFQARGLMGAHQIPLLGLPKKEMEVNWIDMSRSNRDMEWTEWMHYLINCICAIFLIAPEEINFVPYGRFANVNEVSKLHPARESMLIYSRDKGLRPLLEHIATYITREIIWKEFSENYIFTFEGIDMRDIKQELETKELAVSTFKTINEIRAEHDLRPLPWGDIILSPVAMQALQNFIGVESKHAKTKKS